jgi:hypothetical protein
MIQPPFGAIGETSRNDAFDAAPIRVNDGYRDNLADESDADFSSFPVVDSVVGPGNNRAVENETRLVEADAMLGQIGEVLVLIPFKHRDPI